MKFYIFINIFLISPGDIHFWIYDDVTDNSMLDLQRKISICKAFAPPLFCFLSNPMRPRVICKGPSQEHLKQRKMGCVSATQIHHQMFDCSTIRCSTVPTSPFLCSTVLLFNHLCSTVPPSDVLLFHHQIF